MRSLRLYMAMTLTLAGCDSRSSGSDRPAPQAPANSAAAFAPADSGNEAAPSSQPTTLTGSILAPESPEEATPRPAAILVVEGGEAQIAYRGWPIHIAYRRLGDAGAAPPLLGVRGPSNVTPLAAPHATGAWLISPEKSAALAHGAYVFYAGAASTEVVVQDEPAELSPTQQEAKQLALGSYALALGDTAGSERLVRAWVKASNSPTAYAALGDVLVAAGKSDDALAAYDEAARRTPPGVRPPRSVSGNSAALLRESLAALPTRPGAAPSVNELAYYKIVDEADALVIAGDYPRALRAYDRAKSHYNTDKLTLGLDELDRKIAFAREQRSAR
jgi:tetratricopeptide (TPR) repeat protein